MAKLKHLASNFDWLKYYRDKELSVFRIIAATGYHTDIQFAGEVFLFVYRNDEVWHSSNGTSLEIEDLHVLSRLAEGVMFAVREGYAQVSTERPNTLFDVTPIPKKRSLDPLSPTNSLSRNLIEKARTTRLYTLFEDVDGRLRFSKATGASVRMRWFGEVVVCERLNGNRCQMTSSPHYFSHKDYAFLIRIAKMVTDAVWNEYPNVKRSKINPKPSLSPGVMPQQLTLKF